MQDFFLFLVPYRLSWLAILVFGLTAVCFLRGLFVQAPDRQPSLWRIIAFWIGLSLCYLAIHTRFDYYSQFMFFVHRGQHLIIHHLGPLLIALANPWQTLADGVPEGSAKQWIGRLLRSRLVVLVYRLLQHPLVAPVLFVGLIFFWLWPRVHFDAMLNHKLYLLMNWSMIIDGLLFWWLILDPRDPAKAGTVNLGKRILMLWAVMIPQLLLGASITFSGQSLYEIYDICGRAWPLDPMDDQIVGGLLTWIPPAMMVVIATVIVLSRLLALSGQSDLPPEQKDSTAPVTGG